MKTEGVVETDLPGLQHAWLVDPLAASAVDVAVPQPVEIRFGERRRFFYEPPLVCCLLYTSDAADE